MRSLSSVGLGLSVVFGCLLVALLAELYYLLWCKKRFARPGVSNDYSNPAATSELVFILCCRRKLCPSSRSPCVLNPKPTQNHLQEAREQGSADRFGDHSNDGGVESVHGFGNVVGPGLMPRFLFTIMEETKEDLEMESEDGKSMAEMSLGDLFLNMESGATPYLTPLASPSLFTPPLTPLRDSCHGDRNKIRKEGLYTFLESSADAEFNKLVRSSSSSSPSSSSFLSPSASPLPRFKFMRDAEEKLYMRRFDGNGRN
ncbi:PREDICTED: uncharacterized protein LOC104810021 [Tarenaya hassleriana]|uniref:uncharacterized protein LOC104810021 n=1 Tax=Tarenaya hassleriana TaxID=28532 RepID=UPI00053C7856|nr:PREDICTED: uncharacterized protein LOC104810021 [Tarenaya hassleriana]